MRGIVLGLLLISQIAFAEDFRCESLFTPQSEIITHLQKKYHVQIDKIPKTFLTTNKLSPEATEAARELYQLMRFHSEIVIYLENHKTNLTQEEIMDFSDELFKHAEKALTLNGTKFTYKNFLFRGKRKKYFIIDVKGDAPLNKEAASLQKQYGVRVVYNPYELVELNAGALYSLQDKTLCLAETNVATGSMDDNAMFHEKVHVRTFHYLHTGVDYVLLGDVQINKTRLPGKFSSTYNKYLSFDEIDAYHAEIVKVLDEIKNVISDQTLPPDEKEQLFKRYKKIIPDTLDTLHQISAKIFTVTDQSLADLKISSADLSFSNRKSITTVTWKEKDDEDRYYYDMRLYIPRSENASREELVQATVQRLNRIRMLARYHGNIASVGKTLFKGNFNEEEMLATIQQFERILIPQRTFSSLSAVPSQQELISVLMENAPN